MIKAALIGASGYAGLYLNNLLRLQEESLLQLVAVVVKDPEVHIEELQRLNGLGIPVVDSAERLFEEYHGILDLCCIPTSIGSHARLTMEALAAGCHVLVEKPAAATTQDVLMMQERARELGKEVFVGYQNMYTEDVLDIKSQLLKGVIGEVETIKMLGMWPRAISYFDRNEWAGKVKTGDEWIYDSVAHNAFAHFLNLMCYWSGETQHQSANIETIQAELYRANPIESFDTCSVRVGTSNHIELLFLATHACQENFDPEIQIVGSKGTLTWNGATYSLNGKEVQLASSSEASIDHARQTMFNHVVKYLDGENVPVCKLDIAYVLTQCVNAMHQFTEIEEVPESLVRNIETPHGVQRAIIGLEEALKECFASGRVLSELNLAWTVPTKTEPLMAQT